MNSAPPRSRIEYAIICDDLRREDNGKLLIIGAYGGEILVSDLPAVLSLRILLGVYSSTTGSVPVSLKIKQDGKTILDGTRSLNFTIADTIGLLGGARILLEIESETWLEIKGRTESSRFRRISRVHIRKGSL